MATKSNLKPSAIGTKNPALFNRIRTTIETAYYRNNVIQINSLEEAYHLAKSSPGTIVTDLPVYQPEKLGLPDEAKILVFNDGRITGRQAHARNFVEKASIESDAALLREAIYESRYKTMYHATCVIGLHEDFTVKAHLLIPEGYENTLYSWMLNFQPLTKDINSMYDNSHVFDEGDIFLYSDPDYFVEGYDDGYCLFDRDYNCAALLGMRYFGEHKKGTLTLAWSIAGRQDFTACHGGQKRITRDDGSSYVMSVFGLSGSGKSTITHAKHGGKYDITVLHDDAFVINNKNASSVALEPSYFDKVQDYPTDSDDNKFLLTIQNIGVTKDDTNRIVPVTEDIRNGNGRAVKSILWTKNRIQKVDEKVDSIFWIMKDETLPPLLKINSTVLASTLGATLATKRTSAEHGADTSKLAVVPYANPFSLYPLKQDYDNFKTLFETHNVECYVINTGHFLDKKITPSVTLNAIESLVDNTAVFKSFDALKDTEYAVIEGYEPDCDDQDYLTLFTDRMKHRIEFLKLELDERDKLPDEAFESIEKRLKN